MRRRRPDPVDHDLEACPDPGAVAARAAGYIAGLASAPASLVPGDPVLGVTGALVALTQLHQGHRRMTLTYPALARASQLLWLVTGPDKKDPLGKLLAGDQSIPAGRVRAAHSLVLADAAAT